MQSVCRRLVPGVVVLAACVMNAQSARIPVTHATSFSGAQITLPDDLHGKTGVLVLGFSKASGDVSKGWGQRIAARYATSGTVAYYQMPVLEDVPKLIRGMVMKSMRSGVPETEQPHFLPVFSNEAEWKKVSRFQNADDAYVLVVDGDGNIRWQTSGKVSDSGFAALEQQIDAARAQMPKQ